MEPRESDREYGHHIVVPLIGGGCSAQPKMADVPAKVSIILLPQYDSARGICRAYDRIMIFDAVGITLFT